MNRDEILAMEPGRELDALVAEKVMRWEWNDKKTFANGNYLRVEDAYAFDHESGEPHFNWSPSSDISAAWEVVENLQRGHVHISVHWMFGKYSAEIIETDPEDGFRYLGQYLDALTAPEAICKSALLAVMDT